MVINSIMEKILIPLDKANHFIYGFLLFFISNLFLNEIYSFSIVLIIALLKEIVHDKLLGRGTPDYKDVLFTIIPAVLFLLKQI